MKSEYLAYQHIRPTRQASKVNMLFQLCFHDEGTLRDAGSLDHETFIFSESCLDELINSFFKRSRCNACLIDHIISHDRDGAFARLKNVKESILRRARSAAKCR